MSPPSMAMAGPYRPPTVAHYRQQQYSPFDYNKDGKVNFQDVKAVAKKTLDRNNDGKINLDDLHGLADSFLPTPPKDGKPTKRACVRCGKALKKKSKYQTGVCVECYRNPTDAERCVAHTSSGDRCKRRISDKSEKGYCGIHLRKFEGQ